MNKRIILLSRTLLILSIGLLILVARPSHSKESTALTKKSQVSASPEALPLTDSWYVMQSGSTPWGYYHEKIEKRDARWYYRYEMKKKENGKEYHEVIGAIAQEDLTPVAFNLNKAGDGVTEIINGTYKTDRTSGYMNITIEGAKKKSFKRHLSKKTIMEVFFPLHVASKWSSLKQGKKESASILSEDAATADYTVKTVNYSLKSENHQKNCTEFNVELQNQKAIWCLNPKGIIQFIDINNHQVQVSRAASEKEAKAFLNEK